MHEGFKNNRKKVKKETTGQMLKRQEKVRNCLAEEKNLSIKN